MKEEVDGMKGQVRINIEEERKNMKGLNVAWLQVSKKPGEVICCELLA